VALLFHHSSLYMRLLCESKGVTLRERYDLPETDFVASGGAVPIFVRDLGLVGATTVSELLRKLRGCSAAGHKQRVTKLSLGESQPFDP
jgi:uncharacterized protein (UPF0303 family)